ncbi:hypothetical protein OAO87_03805 [bacterium]|nr:hypothetical protein [bacterium]
MLSMLSEQRASSFCADAISEHLRCRQCCLSSASSYRADAVSAHVSCCQCCLSRARQATVLTPSPSICDAANAV